MLVGKVKVLGGFVLIKQSIWLAKATTIPYLGITVKPTTAVSASRHILSARCQAAVTTEAQWTVERPSWVRNKGHSAHDFFPVRHLTSVPVPWRGESWRIRLRFAAGVTGVRLLLYRTR